MITAETLRALIALVEEAKAGSRELDGQLTAAFDPPMNYAGEPADIFIRMNDDDRGVFKSYHATPASYTQPVPPLTTSIDAAIALVAKVLPGSRPHDVLHDAIERMNLAGWRADAPQVPQLALHVIGEMLERLMPPEETSSFADWRDYVSGGERLYVDGVPVAYVFESHDHAGEWAACWAKLDLPLRRFPTASAARSFVEKSVKEAGHGE